MRHEVCVCQPQIVFRESQFMSGISRSRSRLMYIDFLSQIVGVRYLFDVGVLRGIGLQLQARYFVTSCVIRNARVDRVS